LPVDESACNPKPKSVRQTGRYPFNTGHNDLANDNGPFEVSHGRTCPFSAARRTSSGVNGVSGSPGRTLWARRKLVLAERNQQVAMTPDESLSPLYSPLYSPFVRILPLFTTISIAFL